MLRKLLKHELRATARWMLPLYLLVLLLAVGARFSTTWLDTDPDLPAALAGLLDLVSCVVVMGFVVGLIAAFAAALILMIQRFRSNLLGDEGYVMFTLPVSAHQLVWSKLLVSTLWFAGAAIVDVLALSLLVADRAFFADLQELFPYLMQNLSGYYAAHGTLLAVEFLLLCIVGAFALCLVFYAPLAIGHSFDKHKMFLSVVFFLVIQFATNLASGLLFLAAEPGMDALAGLLSAQTPATVAHVGLWLAILVTAVYAAVLYGIDHWMLSKRLNLE